MEQVAQLRNMGGTTGTIVLVPNFLGAGAFFYTNL